ncbi:energy transducer TonB [Larkinella rosea]|uniref:Energy transducer TonB n=1 Tax=Larkinella rosea TaxID=2025312 RepID=A0A3P1C1R7_9BACT|nr:energy transducer TonB [Larkinella rosea]RRB07331.1 energy transducer TonB [Larkinella rosea]
MTTEQLDVATLDDIVFENRNKLYGAYELRQIYNRNASRALWLGIALFGAALATPTLYNHFKPDEAPDQIMTVIDLEKVKVLPQEEPPVVVPPKVEIPVQLPTIRSLPPEVVADAPDEVTVPTVEELVDKVTSDKTQDGDPNALDVIEAPTETAGPAPVEKAVEVERKPDEVFLKVEQDPQFPGGLKGMADFMQKNLHYPPSAARASISGRVYLQFVVNTDGSIVDVSVIKGIGFGCDEEAIRVVNKMPKWQPGKQSGRPVRVRFNLPVVFALE